jgi:pyruvate dehydrogenase E2 component (dihydrolipoamide acetyltransferase)
MPTNILMPALSPSMDKGNIANWLKKEGDRVKVGDVLAEIDTDKATMEYESEDNGILAKILAPAGAADILVNTIIAVLAVEGEDVNAVAASAENGSAGPSAKLSASPLSSPQTVGLGGVMAQAAKQPSGTVWAEWWEGIAHHYLGDQAAAQLHLERGMALAVELGAVNANFFGFDQRVSALVGLARTLSPRAVRVKLL